MNRATLVALATATAITSAAGIGIGSAGETAYPAMTRADYAAARDHIEAARGWALAACAKRAGADRDACEGRTNANADLHAAELDVRYRHTPEAAREAQRARIEVRHQAALARCVPLRGYDRDECLIAAHAFVGRALLESEAPYARRD